jgi:hypothetical protein
MTTKPRAARDGKRAPRAHSGAGYFSGWPLSGASLPRRFELGQSVSVYFFTIRDLDRRVRDDPRGTDLPNVAEALSYAEHKINDLRHEPGYDNPRLIMIVQDEHHHPVWSLPFLPACA